MNAAFWIPCLGLPLAALFSNVVVRLLRKLPQSALPDLILCFVVFDGLVAIQHDDFEKFIRIAFVKEAALAWYVLWFFLNIVIWLLSITDLEHRLVMCHEQNKTLLTKQGILLLGASIVVCSLVILISVTPFAYQG